MKISLPVVFVFHICIGLFFALSTHVHANPTITWQPDHVVVLVGYGGNTIPIPITLTSDTNLIAVKLDIVPKVESFITGVPYSAFNMLNKEKVVCDLEIYVPYGTKFGVYKNMLFIKEGKKVIGHLRITIFVGAVYAKHIQNNHNNASSIF